MAQRAYGRDIQQKSSVGTTAGGDCELADREQERDGDFQDSGQVTRQDSPNSKEAKSNGVSRGEYPSYPITNDY